VSKKEKLAPSTAVRPAGYKKSLSSETPGGLKDDVLGLPNETHKKKTRKKKVVNHKANRNGIEGLLL